MPHRTKSKYQKIESKAKIYYENWRKLGSDSPALNEKIYVTRFGWNHILNPRKRRSKVQKIKRLKALPLARKILETATTYQEHRQDKGINYYAFIAEAGGNRIKVAVSAKGRGPKTFLSVVVLR